MPRRLAAGVGGRARRAAARAGPRRTGSPGRWRRARGWRTPRPLRCVPDRPQPVERACERELRGAQPVDEVAAPDPAGILERAQHRVDGAEAALEAFRRDRLAGEHAMALEHRDRLGVEAFRRGERRRRLDERPPAGGLRRAQRGEPAGTRAAVPATPRRFQRSARSGANVSLVTSPAHTRSHRASSTSRSEPPPDAACSSR